MKRLAWFCCAALVLAAGCDLLDQRRVVPPSQASLRIERPLALSAPDSVLKMLTYVFDEHTPEAADDFADMLYEGYVYRSVHTTDGNPLEFSRADEIRTYRNIFRNFEKIRATFLTDVTYGAGRPVPQEYLDLAPPGETWTFIEVTGDMMFTNTDQYGQETGYKVRQRFILGFRCDSTKTPATWQLAAWIDREPLLTAKIASAPAAR